MLVPEKVRIKIKRKLERCHISLKILFLLLLTFVFYFSTLFIKEANIIIYFIILSFVVLIIYAFASCVLEKETINMTVQLWALGSFIYILIAVPYTLRGYMLTPYIKLSGMLYRLIYTILLPERLLGTFLGGLIILEITSSIEFLRWARIGFRITFLFRAMEYAKQEIFETIDTFRTLGEWPESRKRIISIKEAIKIIKNGTKLAIVVFRNIIIWLPKAWLNFIRIQQKCSY